MSAMQPNYDELIREDLIHGSLYTSPQIYEEELQKIWYKEWVYIGHESEIPQPGDYCTKQLGLQPVIMSRDKEGQVHVLFNRCSHVGNLLCHEERGNSNAFRCPYHGWTFSNSGKLLGVPYSAGYGRDFDREEFARCFSLSRVARVDMYRGFVFASMSPEGPCLDEHLGKAKADLDQLCDLSPEGEIELSAGWLKHQTYTNWKINYENEIDGYHPKFVHRSLIEIMSLTIFDASTDKSGARVRYLGRGHGNIDWSAEYRKRNERFLWIGKPDESKLSRYTRAMETRWGAKAHDKLVVGPPHTVIFPNLFIAELFILVIQPVSVGESIQYQTPIFWKGADELNLRNLRQTSGSIGPAGMVIADDAAMYERNQLGLQAQLPEWLVRKRGMHREQQREDGTLISKVTDETAHRGFWGHYRSLMTGN